MSNPNQIEQTQYYCPFCSKAILPTEILFADEDKGSPAVTESEYDPQRFRDFESQVLTFFDVNVDGLTISMDSRPVYKYHRWYKPGDTSLPFQEPEVVRMPQDCPIPQSIVVRRSNGMRPKQLTGDEPAPWEKIEKVEAEKPKEEEKKVSVASLLKDDILGTVAKAPEHESSIEIDPTMTKKLSEKACPHCHSILPDNFGRLNTYRISMLGGTRSGKTTYMVAAANLLKNQNGLPSGIINGCTISKESARYFDFLIKCTEYNRLAATVMDDRSVIRFVFPIVMNVSATNDQGGEDQFILIINDIPGEGMLEKDFLQNYPGLCLADAAIMLMDPMQFVGAAQDKNTLAEYDWKMLYGEQAFDDEVIKEHREAQFTPHPFGVTLENVKRMITDNEFNLKCFALVLNKFDLLYGGPKPYIDERIANDISYIHGRHHLGRLGDVYDLANSQHDNGMDMELIRQISNQVVWLIQDRLRFSSYMSTIGSVQGITGEIVTLCTSVRNWNDAQECFCRPVNQDGKAEAETILGFRLLEPLLYVLAKLGLVRTKAHVEHDIPDENLGFFQRLARLFHRN